MKDELRTKKELVVKPILISIRFRFKNDYYLKLSINK